MRSPAQQQLRKRVMARIPSHEILGSTVNKGTSSRNGASSFLRCSSMPKARDPQNSALTAIAAARSVQTQATKGQVVGQGKQAERVDRVQGGDRLPCLLLRAQARYTRIHLSSTP